MMGAAIIIAALLICDEISDLRKELKKINDHLNNE